MKVHILDRAIAHIADGAWFYESQSPGLGSYFHDSILNDIRRLRIVGGVHKTHFGGYHRLISRRFPFDIYYRTENGEVFVIAVLDSRRDPDWIREQLTEN